MNSLKSILLKQGSIGAVLRLVSMLSGFASAIILARVLGAEGLGIYAAALALLTICSLPLEFGLPTLVTREVARGWRKDDHSYIRGLLYFSLCFTALTFIPLAVLAAFLIQLSPWSKELVTQPFWWLLLVYIYINGVSSVAAAFLSGTHALIRAQLPTLVLSPLCFLLIVSLIYVFSEDALTPYMALMVQIVSTLAALLLCLGLLALRFINHLNAGRAKYDLSGWIASAWKLGMINGIRRSQPQVLLYILSLLAPLEATGFFRIAQRGASLVSFGISVVTVTSMPYVSSLFADSKMEQLQKLVTRASQIMSVWAAACCIGVIFFGGFLLEYVFGLEFRSAYWMLVFCCLAELARAVFGFSFIGLNMSGHEQQSLVWMTVNLVFSSLAAIMLVPLVGGLGAAVSYAVMTILVFWRVNCIARKMLGIDFGIWFKRQ